MDKLGLLRRAAKAADHTDPVEPDTPPVEPDINKHLRNLRCIRDTVLVGEARSCMREDMNKAIDSLQSIKDAGDDVVEPDYNSYVDSEQGDDAYNRDLRKYIDTLLSAYKRVCALNTQQNECAKYYAERFEERTKQYVEMRERAEKAEQVNTDTVSVDGMKIGEDITLWGIATPVPGTDRHRCLAQVGDVAAHIEIKIRAAQEGEE